MGQTPQAAGWYLDPNSDGAEERWFNGRSWTEMTRPVGGSQTAATATPTTIPPGLEPGDDSASESDEGPAAHTPSPSPFRRWALVAFVFAAVLAGTLGAVMRSLGDESTEGLESASAGSSSAVTGDDRAGSDATSGDAAGEFAPGETGPPETAPPVTVEFDGQCTVEVPGTLEQDELRPWDFKECEFAPVVVEPDEKRWIVVLASLASSDFTAADARQRASQHRSADVLWSSHYPSLNPDLWVVFRGPLPSEGSAADAANSTGGGAYERELSDDPGDRYCLATDGCRGERRQ